jgi:DNA repair exonuclease SbcCD nuclease subunit
MSGPQPFKFVHCADLHLDSPLVDIQDAEPEIAEVLRTATFRAFDRIVDLAIEGQADFLLIAGDVYDGADGSLRAQLHFRDGLRRAVQNGVPCYVAHGNHDPLSRWEAQLDWPDGAYRFPGGRVEEVVVRRDGRDLACIRGTSYPVPEVRANLVPEFRPTSKELFTIGLLHCNVGADPAHADYAPCTLDDLRAAGLNYWALGHIHAKRLLSEQDPCIVYPGNPQGRNVRESGERGCYLVTVAESGRVSPEFRATDEVRWFAEDIDISDIGTADNLRNELFIAQERVRTAAGGRAAILRIRLTGQGSLQRELQRLDSLQDLAAPLRENELNRPDFVWTESVQLATRPAIAVPARRAVNDFVGDFLRAVERLRQQPDCGAAIRELFSRHSEYRVIADQLETFSEEALREIIEPAETRGLDYLLREEE